MAALDVPISMPADGTVKVIFIPTIAGAAPTVAEVTAGTDLSCYLTADGWNPTTDEQVTTDSRLCTKQEFEQPGRVTESLEIQYVFNIDEDEDEARQTLSQGVTGYLGARWGKDVDDDVIAADDLDIYPIKAGIQRKQPPEANSVLRIAQKAFITGPVRRDVAVIA